MNLNASDLKVWVPAKDFEASKRFYLDLGCTLNWEKDALAEFEIGGSRFLLQDYYVEDWANNFMISIRVEDADAWWRHVQNMVESGRHPGVGVNPPKIEPFGLKITTAWDPSNVLLHFGEPIEISEQTTYA